MSLCKIIRNKLVTYGEMSLDGSPTKLKDQKWVQEPCGTPIFGKDSHKRSVCDSCLSGWTGEHNYMINNYANKKLIEKEKLLKKQ